VKNEVFTPEDGVNLLMGIGYDNWEAWYILAINQVIELGDPQGKWQMRQVTEAYKRSQGKPFKVIPDELINLEAHKKKLEAQIAELQGQPKTEEKMGELAVTLGTVKRDMNYLIAKHKLHER